MDESVDEVLHPISLNNGLEASDDEPVDEFLPCGSLSEFQSEKPRIADERYPEVLG